MVSGTRNDISRAVPQNRIVSEFLGPDWHLQDWMAHLGKRQADMVNELGWPKSKASKFYNGEQFYRREVLNELAAWLGIAPYELLMAPPEALALRRFKAAAVQIASDQSALKPIADHLN